MNFLSHFYFEAYNPDSYYVLGVALPDLVKNHNRRWNLHPKKHEAEILRNEKLQSIYEGWKKHLWVDDLFHSSEFFLSESHAISNNIRSLPLENKHLKPFMVGHIGLELILDTLLIRNNKLDPAQFYTHLGNCNILDIEEFIRINGIEQAHEFGAFYDRFKQIQYLLSYKNNESIVYALNRIQFRLSGEFLSEQDTRILQTAIAQCMDSLELNYLSIFEEIEWKIKG